MPLLRRGERPICLGSTSFAWCCIVRKIKPVKILAKRVVAFAVDIHGLNCQFLLLNWIAVIFYRGKFSFIVFTALVIAIKSGTYPMGCFVHLYMVPNDDVRVSAVAWFAC